jgi:hypothetical protein
MADSWENKPPVVKERRYRVELITGLSHLQVFRQRRRL